MRLTIIALLVVSGGLLAACGAAPGSAEWCKGVMNGSVKPTPEEMLGNAEKCAAHELAG